MSDKELIKICLGEISGKLGYPDPEQWRQRDLEHVCDEIEKKTNILISLSTMPRLLNGQFNRLPQIATLNAITVYLGYENWQDFKIKKQKEAPALFIEEAAPVKKIPPKKNLSWLTYKAIVLGMAAILLLIMISAKYFSPGAGTEEVNAGFSAKKITSNDIPNTVVFTYDIDKLDGDSFFIQQSWDQDRRVRIYKNNHTLTDIYYEPGYHNAKLYRNDKVIKTIDVNIPTDRWFFYTKEMEFKGLPAYIHASNPIANGMLSLTPEDLTNSKIDYQKQHFYFYTFFPGKLEVSSDNYKLAVRMRVKELRNSPCPSIMYEVFGQSSSTYFNTTLPGCTSEINARFGNQSLSGKTTDLSGFGTDVRQWMDIEMIVKNKEATVYINHKKIYSHSYSKSSGLISGVAFISDGLCEIDSLELKGLDGKLVYQDNF